MDKRKKDEVLMDKRKNRKWWKRTKELEKLIKDINKRLDKAIKKSK